MAGCSENELRGRDLCFFCNGAPVVCYACHRSAAAMRARRVSKCESCGRGASVVLNRRSIVYAKSHVQNVEPRVVHPIYSQPSVSIGRGPRQNVCAGITRSRGGIGRKTGGAGVARPSVRAFFESPCGGQPVACKLLLVPPAASGNSRWSQSSCTLSNIASITEIKRNATRPDQYLRVVVRKPGRIGIFCTDKGIDATTQVHIARNFHGARVRWK